MKPDTERKKHVSAKIHQKKKNMHVHLSKDLRKEMKQKRRAIGVRKGDKVKIMRGQHAGKEAKVARVSVCDRTIFLEGFTRKTARGKEVPVPFQPSNLLLIALAESKERSLILGASAFGQKETAKRQEKDNAVAAGGAVEEAAGAGEKPDELESAK